MSDETVTAVTEDIYTALANDNEDIDRHIARLKKAMAAEGAKQAVFAAARLPNSNRAGRKLMLSYFKKRGVTVVFE